jgi:hypothetical protein
MAMKKMQAVWMAAGVMAMSSAAVLQAGAQTTMRSTSSSSRVVTIASGGEGGGQAPVKDDLFAGTEVFAKGASDVTEITMDPDTLGMVDGKEGKRAHSMVLNVVRTYTYDKPGMYKVEDVDAFRNKLNSGDWHCSVHTRSLKTGDSTDVCSRHRTDDLVENAIITVSPKELTFIHTIRKKGAGESELSDLPIMLQMRGIGPELSAEMMISRAEMQAHMAMMRPEVEAQMAVSRTEMQAEIDDAMSRAGARLDGMKSLNGMKGLRPLQHFDRQDVPGHAPAVPPAPVMPPVSPQPSF